MITAFLVFNYSMDRSSLLFLSLQWAIVDRFFIQNLSYSMTDFLRISAIVGRLFFCSFPKPIQLPLYKLSRIKTLTCIYQLFLWPAESLSKLY